MFPPALAFLPKELRICSSNNVTVVFPLDPVIHRTFFLFSWSNKSISVCIFLFTFFILVIKLCSKEIPGLTRKLS